MIPEVEIVTGTVLLLLDGVNEIPDDIRRKFALLVEWLEEYNSPKMIVLCSRQDAFKSLQKSKQLSDNMTQLQLQPLTQQQVENMAHNYLEDNAEAFLHQIFPKAVPRLAESSLGSLSRNPFMLASLIYIFEPNQDLPTNTGLIIKILVETLWERELAIKPGLSAFAEIRTVLTGIAYIFSERTCRLPFQFGSLWNMECRQNFLR